MPGGEVLPVVLYCSPPIGAFRRVWPRIALPSDVRSGPLRPCRPKLSPRATEGPSSPLSRGDFGGEPVVTPCPSGEGSRRVGHADATRRPLTRDWRPGQELRVIAKERASRSVWANGADCALRTEGPARGRSAGRWRRPAGAEVLRRVQFDVTPSVAWTGRIVPACRSSCIPCWP